MGIYSVAFLHFLVWNKTNISPCAWITAWALCKHAAFFFPHFLPLFTQLGVDLGTVWLTAMLAGVINTRLSSIRANKKTNTLANRSDGSQTPCAAILRVTSPFHLSSQIPWANKLCARFLPSHTSGCYTWGDAALSTPLETRKGLCDGAFKQTLSGSASLICDVTAWGDFTEALKRKGDKEKEARRSWAGWCCH